MLWEDIFYVDGQSHADLIKAAIEKTEPQEVAALAIEAREQFKLRHVPLLLVRELARHKNPEARKLVGYTLARVIQRPDEIAEFLAIYWKDGKQPLSAQVKKGLAAAYSNFNAYEFAKWQKDEATIKLRDAMFLTHPNPSSTIHPELPLAEKTELFKNIAERTLATPDTWEVALSGGADKKETFTRLIAERKLGALALLRNLRNMAEAGVADSVISLGLKEMKIDRVLPFRFISAAKYAPRFESELEQAMYKSLNGHEKLPGKTVLLIDVSGSMEWKISDKSDLCRIDAASALAILLRQICEDCKVMTFNTETQYVPARKGFALRDVIVRSTGGGTDVKQAAEAAEKEGYDRLIVLTDEQSSQAVGNPLPGTKGYMVNVASYQQGVGGKEWHRIDGWSEAVVDYILEFEKTSL
jgi:hypothetical protein